MADTRCPVLVGRAAEIDALTAALAAASGGAGGATFITGEPGIGKSRLAREAADRAAARGVRVITGRAVPAGAATPYRPLTEALLQALRDRDFPDDASLAPWLPALRAIVPAGPAASTGDHSAAVRGEAVLRLLRSLAAPAALLVILEDLHWADPDTLAVIEYLADNLAGEPVLVVATSRSEPPSAAADLAARLHERRSAAQLRLERLADDQVAEMVRACVPAADPATVSRVQRIADGVPFIVEESLGSPGVPESFAETVRGRLAAFGPQERLVVCTAAVLGRQFDWRLLAAATGLPADVVSGALERGVEVMLLTAQGEAFRFRHTLTREAVAGTLLPPRLAALAASALAAVEAAHPELPSQWRDLAADLAAQAGDQERTCALLLASGRDSLGRGALATAIGTLRRAAQLADRQAGRAEAETLLVGALALAGHVAEAMTVGDELIAALTRAGAAAAARAEVHLTLAHAAVESTGWAAATRQLIAAADLLAADPRPDLLARTAVLEAEVAFAANDVELAGRRAASALGDARVSPDVRCHALELLGRIQRIDDLEQARLTFGQALDLAAGARLPLRQLRALHELGTIEMFDHAGTDLLRQARLRADELGAISTGAVIDLQLTAAGLFRFDVADAASHARSALATASRLGLSKTKAIVLLFLGEVHAVTREREEMERFLGLADAAAPGDPEIEGSAWAGGRGMLALLEDDWATATAALGRGIAILDTLPQQGPAAYRGVWPVLLAASGDPHAEAAIAAAYRSGVAVNRANRGMLGYANAILAGRAGDRERAGDLARAADRDLAHFSAWGDLARLCAAEPATADRWGEPRRWLEDACLRFTALGIDPLAARCRRLLAASGAGPWARLGITGREAEVLRLVADGLANREIAARLYLSPRTVEKHVEALMRKTGARSRTHLVAVAGPEAG